MVFNLVFLSSQKSLVVFPECVFLPVRGSDDYTQVENNWGRGSILLLWPVCSFLFCGYSSGGRYMNYFFFASWSHKEGINPDYCHRFLLIQSGFCHFKRAAEPGPGVFLWAAWQPVVCRSEMTRGLILLVAVAHLSATGRAGSFWRRCTTPGSRDRSHRWLAATPCHSGMFLLSQNFWGEGWLVFFFSPNHGLLIPQKTFGNGKSFFSFHGDLIILWILGHSWGVIALVFGRGMFKPFFFLRNGVFLTTLNFYKSNRTSPNCSKSKAFFVAFLSKVHWFKVVLLIVSKWTTILRSTKA